MTAVVTKIGEEFLFWDHHQGDVTGLSNGGFVISSRIEYQISAEVFDASGAQVGSGVLARDTLPADTDIVGLTNGGFVFTRSETSASGWLDTYAQVFDATCAKVGSEVLVSSGGKYSDVCALTGGGFVVTWSGSAQVFDASGAKVGSKFFVNSGEADAKPDLCALTNGNFVAMWNDTNRDIKAQVFSPSGAAVGTEFLIDTGSLLPEIVGLNDGGFAVTWMDGNSTTGAYDAKIQVFDATGASVGANVLVSQTIQSPTICALANGGFVVTWRGDGNTAVWAQVFDATGTKAGAEFIVTPNAGNLGRPTITSLSNGDFVILWNDGNSGHSENIKAQMFHVDTSVVVSNALADHSSSEDQAWSVQLPVNTFSDTDGRALSYIARMGDGSALPAWVTFDAATQTFSGTPPLNFNGSLDFKVTASDGLFSASDTFSLTITPLNDAPTTTVATLAAIAEDSGPRLITQADLLAGATDIDGDNLTATNLAIATGSGTLVDNHNGTWSFTPALDDDRSVTFSFTVGDGTLTTAGSASLDITPTNDAPQLWHPTSDQISPDDQSWSFQVPANAFSDIDGDTLTFSASLGNDSALPAWLTFNATTRTFSGTPPLDFNGAFDLKVTASDGWFSASDTFRLSVTPVNDAPVLVYAIADQSSPEDQAWTFQVPIGAFSDFDGDTLTFSAALGNGGALPAWLAFNATTRTFSGTPPLNFNGTLDLKVTASDGALSASDTFRLNVTPVNDAPIASPVTLPVAWEETPFTITTAQLLAGASDVDGPGLTISSFSLASSSGTLLDNGNGTWTVVPGKDFNGTLAFNFSVTDGSASASSTAIVNVAPVNDAPFLTTLSNGIVSENSPNGALAGRLSTYDLDEGDWHSYALLNDAGGRFELHGSELRVRDGVRLDYEQASQPHRRGPHDRSCRRVN